MPVRNLKIPQSLINLGYNIPDIIDITDQLPKNPAYTWEQLTGIREEAALTDIVVHHTGVAKAVGCTAERHARNHINSKAIHAKGEPGIPYHIYIKEGQISQVNDLLAFVYGVGNNNPYTVHIVTEGDFTQDAFTETDRVALYVAILAVKSALPGIVRMKGHNEYNPTTCPAIDMNRVRADVATLEQRMKQVSTWEGRMEQVKPLYNQINYMTDLIKAGPDSGEAQWALSQLQEVVAVMKSKSLL